MSSTRTLYMSASVNSICLFRFTVSLLKFPKLVTFRQCLRTTSWKQKIHVPVNNLFPQVLKNHPYPWRRSLTAKCRRTPVKGFANNRGLRCTRTLVKGFANNRGLELVSNLISESNLQ